LIIGGIITFETDLNANGKFARGPKKDMIFALLAAILVGLAIVIRKMGLDVLDEPLLGVTVGFTTRRSINRLAALNRCQGFSCSLLTSGCSLLVSNQEPAPTGFIQ
jgi:hypothetical protein